MTTRTWATSRGNLIRGDRPTVERRPAVWTWEPSERRAAVRRGYIKLLFDRKGRQGMGKVKGLSLKMVRRNCLDCSGGWSST